MLEISNINNQITTIKKFLVFKVLISSIIDNYKHTVNKDIP